MEKTCTPAWISISEIDLVYRAKVKASERPTVRSSQDAYKLLIAHWDIDKLELLEQFKMLLLNRAGRVLGIYELSSGGIAGTVADPKLIFAAALKAAATGIILAHNHPSGDLQPSERDRQLTEKVRQGGKLLDIVVMDHFVISVEGYFSFADEGLL